MDDFTPVPFGALRAVFRDPSAPNGLMVRPVVGFAAPPSPGGAVVFGGPDAANYPGPPPAANDGVHGVPVVMTRRGELRAVRTALPAPEGPDDVQDAAPASIGLVDGVEPGPEYLGIVQSHEDPADVFRSHVDAANAHRAAVEASRAAQNERAELPPRTVPADVADTAPAPSPAVRRAARDLDAILHDVRALTNNDIEAMGENPEDW